MHRNREHGYVFRSPPNDVKVSYQNKKIKKTLNLMKSENINHYEKKPRFKCKFDGCGILFRKYDQYQIHLQTDHD